MTTEAERSYRRRLFATALPDTLPSTAVRESITVLDQEFGDVPNLKYSDVIARLENNLTKAEVNLNRLLGRIMQLKRKDESDLQPDPLGGSARGAASGDPRTKVFNTLFSSIIKQVDRRSQLEALKNDYKQNAFTLGLSADCVKSVTEWAGSNKEPRIVGENSGLHKVVNHAFVWMCNRFGPVEADRILVSSVKAAEALPEAFDCSPREFL